MKKEVIAIFDIGKTNKKILLFDLSLNVIFQEEEKFNTICDEDGDECDDIDLIEAWIRKAISDLLKSEKYLLKAVNFSTYGASLVFIDDKGKRLSQVYNYLKEVPSGIQEELFRKNGGQAEFCRKTASPALGLLLNSGVQILWIKKRYPELYKNTRAIVHFPQYLSYLLSKEIVSESTSIGCHTFLWDFDNNTYHKWLSDIGLTLPVPKANNHVFPIELDGQHFSVGIGIHDSSASLVPYIRGSKENFLLVSTGTWCINMNPFNHSPLTEYQLQNDCLSYLSVDQHPVKSSRLFMGHIHDVNTLRLSEYFDVPKDSYKCLLLNETLLSCYLKEGKQKVFFKNGITENYIDSSVDLSQFEDFQEAYHRLMYDLTLENSFSIDLILDEKDETKRIYVSGGFARNEIFIHLLASFYPGKKVYTTEIDNSSALGAALLVRENLSSGEKPVIELGLRQKKAFSISDA